MPIYKRGKCDFPWEYNSRAVHSDTKFGGGATGSYDVISDEEALELWAPWIASLFDNDNAVCFFWITWPKVEHCLKFIRACGFDIATLGFDWIKTYPKSGEFFRGPGFYSGSNSELMVIGVRGSMEPAKRLIGQVHETITETGHGLITIKEPHPRDESGKIIHSKKPDIFTENINLMYPEFLYGQAIGLFEREPQGKGWDVFGNQVEGSIAGPDFRQLKLGVK